MSGLTRQVADFVSSLKLRDIPAASLNLARFGIVDCVGVLLAGSRMEGVRIVSSLLETSLQNDAAPEIPSGRKLAPGDAALVNGVAAHVLDYDDVALASHPSSVLVPALLAEGWTLDSSGADCLTAYVAAYEVWALLADVEPELDHAAIRLFCHPLADHADDNRDRVARANRLQELPRDVEEAHHGAVHQPGARRESERHADDHRPMRDPPAEVALRREQLIHVQWVEVGRQPRERADVRRDHGAARRLVALPDFKFFVVATHRLPADPPEAIV